MLEDKKTKVCFMQIPDISEVKRIERECGLSPWSVKDYEEQLVRKNSISLVLKQDEEITGFLIARLIKSRDIKTSKSLKISEAEIYNIAVKHRYQGQGCGRKLLDEFLKICSTENVREIWLEVRRSNKKAINFYNRHGFEFVYLRKNFYSLPPEDAVVLKLENRGFESN